MSKLTEILKLFCYDPETDGANTFNIPKALNENWEKIDQLVLLAVAAAAAYDPEGSYAVGDYCTHGGKLHKCNTPIPSGEAWNEEHWTETTVAKELVGKADKTPPQVRNLTLQSGFLEDEGTCTFFKTQENVVFLAGGVAGTLPALQLTQIGTLPANFCPVVSIRRDATTDKGTAFVEIRTDGTVWIYPFATATRCWFSAPFETGMKGEA